MSSAHEAVFIEDDIAIFAAKGSASFGEAIDILSDISDADLDEFEVAAERWGAHVSCAVDRTRFVRYDLFKSFEANEFAAGEEAVARLELNFASDANKSAIEAVEVFDVELSSFDEQAAVSWGEEGIGGEAGIARASDNGFVVFEGDADAIRAVFVDGDQRDIERDGCKLDFRELFFAGIIAEVCGAEAAIFIRPGADCAAASAWDAIFRRGIECAVEIGGLTCGATGHKDIAWSSDRKGMFV